MTIRILVTGNIVMSYKVPANLIRQWCFCPRIVYYRELLNLQSAKPLWVQQGEDKHIDFNQLIRRRRFNKLGLENGTRHFNVVLESPQYSFYGIADLVIECDDAVYPVDYKSGNKIYRGQIMQMAAYCMLAQDKFDKPAPFGIFLYGDKGTLIKTIENNKQLQEEVTNICQNIIDALNKANKPASNASVHQCMQCEYLNYCNDRG